MASYNLRKKETRNYREMAELRLPRPERVENKLYPIEVLERRKGRVKIHYVGYDSIHDEWRNEDEITDMEHSEAGALQMEDYKPFDLHYELAYAIKAALRSCLPRRDPDVRLEIPFDLLIFNGGLKLAGTFVRKFRGHDIYTIRNYHELAPLLGKRWYLRVLNEQQDFCAVKEDTVLVPPV